MPKRSLIRRFPTRFAGTLLLSATIVSLAAQSTSAPAPPAATSSSMFSPSESNAFRIVGYNDMKPMLEGIDALWRRDHPDVVPDLILPGTATAAGALTLGFSKLAPMGAEFSERELVAYRANIGGDPLRIRVAHCSMNPAARSAPIGIYVNIENPLARLTVRQVARIFTSGSPEGDLSEWSQLVEDKRYAQASIHACGIAHEAAAGLSPYMLAKLDASSYSLTYTPLPQSRDAVKCVADDKFAIAFASANIVDPHTKLVAIAEKPSGPYVLPTADQIVAGAYPFDRFLYIYLRNVPGAALDPAATAYVQLILSPEGQRVIAAAAPGYLPLNSAEIAAESAKLNSVMRRSANGPVAILASSGFAMPRRPFCSRVDRCAFWRLHRPFR